MLIKLKVHPDSRTASLVRKAADAYEIWVRSPAENGRANRESLAALARALSLDPKQLHIVKGATSPNKIIKILGH